MPPARVCNVVRFENPDKAVVYFYDNRRVGKVRLGDLVPVIGPKPKIVFINRKPKRSAKA